MTWPIPPARRAHRTDARARRRGRFAPRVGRLEPRTLLSLSIEFNYSYDSNHFFNTPAKRDVLQAAADAIAGDLNNSLSAIAPGGGNTWTADVFNPSNPSQTITLTNPTIAANTVVIYVGGATMSGSEAGLGGFGGVGASGSSAWISTVQTRGESGTPAPFAPWGGAISFDDSAGTSWYFGTDPSGLQASQTDFFTVAEHEIGHLFGIGTSPQWSAQLSNGKFTGPASEAAYGGVPVPVSPDLGHFAEGTTSAGQAAVMTPVLADGARLYFTPLDFAALEDLGWQVQATAPVVQLAQAATPVADNAGGLVVTLTRTGSLAGPASVTLSTGGGTATPGVDYTSTTMTVTFAPGQATATVAAPPILVDPSLAGPVTFDLTLSGPTNGAVLGATSTEVVTIEPVGNTTATALVPLPSTVPVGQPLRLTAQVTRTAASGLVAGGSVAFLDGATVLGTAHVVNGQAQLAIPPLAAGGHGFGAVYLGDAADGSSRSAAVGTSAEYATTTTLAASTTAPAAGAAFTLTATVASSLPGAPTPTGGAVTFYDGATSLGSATLSHGVATLNVALASQGQHRLTAAYAGYGAGFAPSASTVTPASTIVSIAGQAGQYGYSGDGGPATSAKINSIIATGVDAAGNIYLADGGANVIRKISPSGIITTVAGTGVAGDTGDGGAATSAKIQGLAGMVVDAAGDIYFSDDTDEVVREVTAGGIIRTVAGDKTAGQAGNGGPATSAELDLPMGLTIDAAGDLFIAEYYNYDVRDVTPAGIISTVAGSGARQYGYSGDGGPATSALLVDPTGVAVDAFGDLFVVDNASNVVREVNTAGIISTVVGNGTAGYAGEGGPAVAGELHEPGNVTVDALGDLFINDVYNNVIREVSPAGVITTVVGTGAPGPGGDGGPASAATLNEPEALALDAAGDLVVPESDDTRLHEVINGLPVVVGAPATTTTLSSSTTTPTFAQPVTLTAVVSASDGSDPTGTVTFYDGATALGTGTLSMVNGVDTATATFPPLAPGAHTITAAFPGGSGAGGSTSAPLTLTVGPNGTRTAVALSSNNTVYGQSVTMTATVSILEPGSGTPTGSVTFMDGSTTLGTGTLSTSNGVTTATFTTAALPAAGHSIAAVYGGDASDQASTSSALSLLVGPDATRTVVTASPAYPTPGQDVTLTATVSVLAPGAGTPTGIVTFMDGSTSLGTGTLATANGVTTASVVLPAVADGSHAITASYGGDADDQGGSGALTIVVNANTTTTSLAVSPGSAVVGQPVTLTATVTSSGSPPTGTVDFLDGMTVLGPGTLSTANGVTTATFTTSALGIGPRSLTASYLGDPGDEPSVSSASNVSIGQDATETTLSASTAAPVLGQSVTLTATVGVNSPGSGAPTGTVTFKDGSAVLGSGTLSTANGVTTATFTTSALAVGSHPLTATYGGDGSDLGSGSAAMPLGVGKDATVVTVAASSTPVTEGWSFMVTATVAQVAPGTSAPTGSVTFYDGATAVGTSPISLSPGVRFAVMTASGTLKPGTHTITAVYSGDANDAAATSALASLTVLRAVKVAVSESTTQPVRGQPVTFTTTLTPVDGGAAPTGTVELVKGTTVLATATVTAAGGVATATLTTAALPLGPSGVGVLYLGDAGDGAAVSSQASIYVVAGATTTVAFPATYTPVRGQAMMLVAVVSPVAPGAGTPSGTVSFLLGSSVLATVPVVHSGASTYAAWTTGPLVMATYTITAVYNGDAGDLGSSGSTTFTAGPDATTVSVGPSDLAPVRGELVAIGAFVSAKAPGSGAPTGRSRSRPGRSRSPPSRSSRPTVRPSPSSRPCRTGWAPPRSRPSTTATRATRRA